MTGYRRDDHEIALDLSVTASLNHHFVPIRLLDPVIR